MRTPELIQLLLMIVSQGWGAAYRGGREFDEQDLDLMKLQVVEIVARVQGNRPDKGWKITPRDRLMMIEAAVELANRIIVEEEAKAGGETR